ncbi:hypothetical protein KJ359_002527 [Pestalotiopsis sp. 9143b]|nr:hypothetical protein KJ359_002527 [Pestalotiopsis sp. 9143b]
MPLHFPPIFAKRTIALPSFVTTVDHKPTKASATMDSHLLDDDLDHLRDAVDDSAVLLPATLINVIDFSASTNAPGGSPIETFPSEILQMIMKSMDLETLLVFTQASKTTHAAYKQAEALILHGVSENTIGAELLPIAANCFMAGSLRGLMWSQRPASHDDDLPYYDPDVTVEFIEHYISKQALTLTLPPAHFGIFEAIRLVSFHEKLLRLADEALRVFEGRYADRYQQFVQYTREEKNRVLKALYLFDLVHLIVSPALTPLDVDPRDRKVRNAFWRRFAPWDFEQVTHLVDTFLGPSMMRSESGYPRPWPAEYRTNTCCRSRQLSRPKPYARRLPRLPLSSRPQMPRFRPT